MPMVRVYRAIDTFRYCMPAAVRTKTKVIVHACTAAVGGRYDTCDVHATGIAGACHNIYDA